MVSFWKEFGSSIYFVDEKQKIPITFQNNGGRQKKN